MKLMHIVLLILAGVISIASANGVAEEQNKDRTGTPDGSNTCGTCHTGGGFSPSVSIELLNQNEEAVSVIVPEALYTLRVSVSNFFPFPDVYGFQATALNSELGNSGFFSNPGNNVQVENVDNNTLNNRHVIEHAFPSFTGNFTADWTAPAVGDSVYFYAAGVTANGNDEPEGDNGETATLALAITAADDVEEMLISRLTITTHNETIWIDHPELARLDALTIYSLSGGQIYDQQHLGLPFALALESAEPHFFLLHIKQGEFDKTYKVLVP